MKNKHKNMMIRKLWVTPEESQTLDGPEELNEVKALILLKAIERGDLI